MKHTRMERRATAHNPAPQLSNGVYAMSAMTYCQALTDIMLGSEPEVMFEIGKTYRTRAVFCRDGETLHQSAKVTSQVNDHMQRLWLLVEYSDGHTGQVLADGTTGLGYQHACDLIRRLTMQKIVTSHVYPPIPIRTSDWCAHWDGEEEAGNYGWGRTEADAVADFIANLDDLPCKNTDKRCAANGSCLRCAADAGEECR